MNDARFEGLSRTLAGTSSRRQALKLLGGGVAGAAVLGAGVPGVGAARNSLTRRITGTIPGVSQFVGTFTVEEFAVRNGQLVALGTLEGRLKDLATGTVQQVSQQIALPVTGGSGSCQILRLELGPLDLNLLGLRVQLNRVVLVITAERGSLLGDLLCAIANLLNGSALGGLAGLLNNLLAALG
jgi:hypothetical protein